jgi:hypothetical protein
MHIRRCSESGCLVYTLGIADASRYSCYAAHPLLIRWSMHRYAFRVRFIQPFRSYNLLSRSSAGHAPRTRPLLVQLGGEFLQLPSAQISNHSPRKRKSCRLTSSRLLGFSKPLACSSLNTWIPGPVLSNAVGLLPTKPDEAEGSWPRSEGLLVFAGWGWMVNSRGRRVSGVATGR